MKRFFKWICLITAFLSFSQNAWADFDPEELYVSYIVDNDTYEDGWTKFQKITLNNDKFEFTFPACRNYVLFKITTTSGKSLEDLDNNNKNSNHWNEYYIARPSGGNYEHLTGDAASNSKANYNILTPGDCMWNKSGGRKATRINGAGTYTITLTKGAIWDNNRVYNISYSATGTQPQPGNPTVYKARLPLTARDFANGKKHYFLVGTRMADWRLQPEWELKDLGDGKYGIANPRIMYLGLMSVAVVDNYDDYVYGRYTRYWNGVNYPSAWDGKTNTTFKNSERFDFYASTKPAFKNSDRYLTTYGDNNSAYNYTSYKESKGVVVNSITLTTDDNGAPLSLVFDNTNSGDVAKYLTFSLVGGKIKNQALETAGQYKTQETVKPSYSWENGWIQYDPETGEPYRDENGRLFYQTVYQKDWLDSHPSYFNMNLGSGRTFDYTSNNIVMSNASLLTDAELADDPYAPLYKRFNADYSGVLGTINGNNESSYSDVSLNYNGKTLNYKEQMLYHGNEKGEGSDTGHGYGYRTANWECFVVKDMWMDGTFKVWTGWGGGYKRNENTGANNGDENNARWYFVNGGHGQATRDLPVNGYDVAEGANARMYATFRDINGADFMVGSTSEKDAVAPDSDVAKNTKPVYFKRVIVWFDPQGDFTNSAIQFIREKLGPNIQAFRGTMGSQIDYKWNIPSDMVSEEEGKYPVEKYVITRYRMDENGQMVRDRVVQTIRPDGKNVNDFFDPEADGCSFNDSNLPGGTYQYKVELTYKDNNTTPVTKDAWSNRITLYDASQPVEANASQRTEETTDGQTLYSFDFDLNLKLTKGSINQSITEGGNTYTVNDLATGYLVNYPEELGKELGIEKTTREVYDGTAKKSIEGYWVEKPFPTDGDDSKSATDKRENVTPGTYTFDVYLVPNKENPGWDKIFAAANFGKSQTTLEMVVPNMQVAFDESGVTTVDYSGITPDEAMPVGTHVKHASGKPTQAAPINYGKVNNLWAQFHVVKPAVTASVTENFDLTYDINVDGKPVAYTGADNDNTFTVNYLDPQAEMITNMPASDGMPYWDAKANASTELSATGAVTYTRKAAANAAAIAATQPASVAHGVATTPEFPAAAVTLEKSVMNTYEAADAQGYYLHDVYALLNITGAQPDLAAYYGFHIMPDAEVPAKFLAEEKAQQGGIVIPADYAIDNMVLDHLDGYTPWSEEADVWNDDYNWAKSPTLPVRADRVVAREKSKADSNMDVKGATVTALGSIHYPFLVADRAAAAPAAETPSSNDGYKMVTITKYAQQNLTPTKVLTGIDTVGADDTDAEYYNLQGMRIARPASGTVCIVRSAGRTVKALIR